MKQEGKGQQEQADARVGLLSSPPQSNGEMKSQGCAVWSSQRWAGVGCRRRRGVELSPCLCLGGALGSAPGSGLTGC